MADDLIKVSIEAGVKSDGSIERTSAQVERLKTACEDTYEYIKAIKKELSSSGNPVLLKEVEALEKSYKRAADSGDFTSFQGRAAIAEQNIRRNSSGNINSTKVGNLFSGMDKVAAEYMSDMKELSRITQRRIEAEKHQVESLARKQLIEQQREAEASARATALSTKTRHRIGDSSYSTRDKGPSYNFSAEERAAQKVKGLIPVIDPETRNIFYVKESDLRNNKVPASSIPTSDIVRNLKKNGRGAGAGYGWSSYVGDEKDDRSLRFNVLQENAYKEELKRMARTTHAYDQLYGADKSRFIHGGTLSDAVPSSVRDLLSGVSKKDIDHYRELLNLTSVDSNKIIRDLYNEAFPKGSGSSHIFSSEELDALKSYREAADAADKARTQALNKEWREQQNAWDVSIRQRLINPAVDTAYATMGSLKDGTPITDPSVQAGLSKFSELLEAFHALTGIPVDKYIKGIDSLALMDKPAEELQRLGFSFVKMVQTWESAIDGKREVPEAWRKSAASMGLIGDVRGTMYTEGKFAGIDSAIYTGDINYFKTILDTQKALETGSQIDDKALIQLLEKQNEERNKRVKQAEEELHLLQDGNEADRKGIIGIQSNRDWYNRTTQAERFKQQEDIFSEAKQKRMMQVDVSDQLPSSVKQLFAAMNIPIDVITKEVMSRYESSLGRTVTRGGGTANLPYNEETKEGGLRLRDVDYGALQKSILQEATSYIRQLFTKLSPEQIKEYLVKSADEYNEFASKSNYKTLSKEDYAAFTTVGKRPLEEIASSVAALIVDKIDTKKVASAESKEPWGYTTEQAMRFAQSDLLNRYGSDERGSAVGYAMDTMRSSLLEVERARRSGDVDSFEQSLNEAIKILREFFSHSNAGTATKSLEARIQEEEAKGEDADLEQLRMLQAEKKSITTLLESGRGILNALEAEESRYYSYTVKPEEHSVGGFIDTKHLSPDTLYMRHLSSKQRQEALAGSTLNFEGLMTGAGYLAARMSALEKYAPQVFGDVGRNLMALDPVAGYQTQIRRYDRATRPENLDLSELPVKEETLLKLADALEQYNSAVMSKDKDISLLSFAQSGLATSQVSSEILRVLPFISSGSTAGFSEAQAAVYTKRIEDRDRERLEGEKPSVYEGMTDADIVVSVYTDFIRGYLTAATEETEAALRRQGEQEIGKLKTTAVEGISNMLDGISTVLKKGYKNSDGTFELGLLNRSKKELLDPTKNNPTDVISSIGAQYAPLIREDAALSTAYTNFRDTLSSGESSGYTKKWKDQVAAAFAELTRVAGEYFEKVKNEQVEVVASAEKAADKEVQIEEKKEEKKETVRNSKKDKPARSTSRKTNKTPPNIPPNTPPNEGPSTNPPSPPSGGFKPDWATEKTLEATHESIKATNEKIERLFSMATGKEINPFAGEGKEKPAREPFSTEDLTQIEKISGAYPELVSNFSRINAEDVHQMEEQFRQAAEAMGVTVDDLVHKEENGVRQVTAIIHKGTEEAKITVKQAGEDTKTTVEDVSKNVKSSAERSFASLQSVLSLLSPILKGIGVKQLVSAAGAAEKALKSLQATTGRYAKEALAMVDTLNEAYGMSKTQAAQALTYAYNQISEVGISNNQALQMSDALVQLGADYSAYYGGAKSAMEVTQALTQVMLGSYRAARQYGIAISSTDVEQLAIAYGKQANNLSEAEKMLYRYQVVMSRASNVMGEYERTSGTYFNAQQELNKAWADAKIALGDQLLPIATDLLHVFTDLTESLGDGGVGGTLLLMIVTATSAASAFMKLAKSVEGLAKAVGISNIAMGGIIAGLVTLLSLLAIWASTLEKKKEEEREAAAAAYAHADAIDAVSLAMQRYTASLGTNEEALRKRQLAEVVSELGTAYSENQGKLTEIENTTVRYASDDPFDYVSIGSQKALEKDKEQYTKQRDNVLSAMLSAAQGLLPYTKNIDDTIETIVSMTDLEGDELTAVKKYLKENLSIYDAIAANAKAVVDYSSKLKTAEKNLVSLAQKRLESRNELYEAYKIELQYLDEVYNKELDIAKEAASNTLTVNMESAITNAKHALDYAKGDDDTEALADRLEQLQNADLNEIEVFVTDEMNAEGFKGTEEQLGVIIKQLMDMYGFEETEAALIVGAYKSMTDRQKLYLKESEKLLLDYIDKQDVAENELKKSEFETIGGDIYQSMDARRQAYSDLLELQNDEVNTAYTNQVTLIKKALSEGKISQEEYNAYMDRAERKRLRDSKANFDSYVNNIKNATDEIANTRRELLSGRASDIGDAQSVYDLAKESADITYQNAVINKADLLRTEIDSIFKQLPSAEGEEYEQLLVRYAAAYKELISITGETAAEQAAYNERVQQAKDNAYLEYIRALSAAFDEYAHSIVSAKTPLEEFNEATRTLAEHVVDQTSDPTGAITAYRNTRQAIWDAQSNINTLREAGASAISRFEKEDKYRGKIDFKKLADANASGELADMNIEELLLAGVDLNDVDTVEMEKFLKEYADKTKDIARNEFADVADAIADGLTQGLSAIDELLSMNAENEQIQIQNRISALKKAYDDMKEQMEKRNDQSYDNLTRSQKDAIERQKKMDEDELERQQALIEEQEAMLEEAKRKEFERQKAFNIAEATIAGIKGAIDAYTSMASIPYVGTALGIAAAAAVTAFTAAKINAIASQEYQASYAQGAYNLPQDQTAQVHKGEMIIPRPFAQELRDEVSGNSSYSSSDEITINVYGATDDVSVESNTVEGNQQLDIYLTQRVKTMVARGELDNALQTRYSISKNGRRS